MRRVLVVDFGSTFTKVRAIDVADGTLLSSAQAPTTVQTGILHGLLEALNALGDSHLSNIDAYDDCLASSSAGGGLRIVSIGLVKDLTAEAARRAALGAGGKVVAAFAGELTRSDLQSIRQLRPDLIILAGGTDGGDRRCITYNAGALAGLDPGLVTTIVVAGNHAAIDDIDELLAPSGHHFTVVPNVLPNVHEINVGPSSEAIRDAFMARIIQAKGLDIAEKHLGRVLMPTPRAVLEGCVALAEGAGGERGLGDLMCVDVGGATTDVYSITEGSPSREKTTQRGLPEPRSKRTVEGDLGVRINALSVVEAAGRERLDWSSGAVADAAAYVSRVSASTEYLPVSATERSVDVALARVAVKVAVRRHAGTVELAWGPHGKQFVQFGKDLGPLRTLVGTGGVVSSMEPEEAASIRVAATWDEADAEHLLPRAPVLLLDRDYVLFAAGLLAAQHPGAALQLLRRSLLEGDDGEHMDLGAK